MANVTIVTDIFRASHVHLKERKKFTEKDEAAFRIAALFPKDGVGEIAALGITFHSSPQSIIDAISEVTMSEWNWAYDPADEQFSKANGVQFPPTMKDGDMVFQKDENGNPIPGVICPINGGNDIFNMKNVEDVGVASGVTGKGININAAYSGCWGRAQLEISAYTTKGTTPARIISVKLINFLMCYDDESLGGHGPSQSAEDAFAGSLVTDSNLSVSAGNSEIRPEPTNQARPTKPVPGKAVAKLVMNDDSIYSYKELVDLDWTDQDIIEGGYATMVESKPLPVKKAVPAKKTPPAKKELPMRRSAPETGGVTMNPDSEYSYAELINEFNWSEQEIIDAGLAVKATVSIPAKKSLPVKKTPPMKKAPIKSVPTTGTVIMNADSEYTYDQLVNEFEWTDEDIVNAGYAKPNFTNPQ